MALRQFDRDYSLYLGWWETATAPENWRPPLKAPARKGILVKDLHIEFEVNKVISNQQSPSTSKIRIFNLTAEQSAALEEFQCGVKLLVGYKSTGTLIELCLGNAVVVKTKKQGADRVTEIVVSEAHAIRNNTKIISTIPAGKTVRDVLTALILKAGLTVGVLEGEKINSTLLYGYPIEGSFSQIMDEIAQAYRLDYSINGSNVSVRDRGVSLYNTAGSAFIFNESTGLLDIPYYEEWGEGSIKKEGQKKKQKQRVEGIVLKALINPAVVPGSVIKLDRPLAQEGEVKNGFYLVREATYSGEYFGGDWTMSLRCDPAERYT